MSEVKAIRLSDGRFLYVEIDPVEISAVDLTTGESIDDLPDGAEPVGFGDKVIDSMQAMRENITAVAETVRESFREHQPEEWTLELNMSFKGKTSPIPVILSGETQGGIKVTAKWKKKR